MRVDRAVELEQHGALVERELGRVRVRHLHGRGAPAGRPVPELAPVRPAGDVGDDVELLPRLLERALEREVVARRDDQLMRRATLAQERRQGARKRWTGSGSIAASNRSWSSSQSGPRPASSRRTARPAPGRAAGRSGSRTRGRAARRASPAPSSPSTGTTRPVRSAFDHVPPASATARGTPGAAIPPRGAGSPPAAAAARARARCLARRRSARARPGRPRAPRPGGRSGRGRASAGAGTSRATDARARARRARRRRRRAGRARASASIRSSSAASRSSSSRRIAGCAKSSKANSASAGPRQSPSASRSVARALSGSVATRVVEQPLEPHGSRFVSRSTWSTYPGARVSSTPGAEQPAQLRNGVLQRGRRRRGGRSPHSSSTRRSVGTTRPASSSRIASSAAAAARRAGAGRRRRRPRAARAAETPAHIDCGAQGGRPQGPVRGLLARCERRAGTSSPPCAHTGDRCRRRLSPARDSPRASNQGVPGGNTRLRPVSPRLSPF